MSALSELYREIALCRRCEIAKSRTRVVPGEGAENAGIMFIGEAPGWHEDQQGRPFVGPAGQFLEHLLTSIGLRREQVYITNIIKSRPPNNREPLPIEIQNCSEWLDRQIQIIHPKMIVTLGRYSMARFFPEKSISKVHGTAQKRDGIIYFAMYHPAAALHQQSLRQTIEADMLKITAVLSQAETVAEPGQQAQQLSMF
ncbi:MAG: uracil-DNA glycosylase [Dehalococcoidales bacterium]|nr:uracil-DNA glycosylase [Dehalococcoidales bacterium]